MLISFSVTNFRSIYEKQKLTFIATKYSSLSEGLLRAEKIESGVLPLIAIYGSNAAGKTNMLRALNFFSSAISSSHNTWKPEAKIRTDPHFFHADEPTEFECKFLFSGEIYRLGFSLNEDRIIEEHLYTGRKLVYKRELDQYRFGSMMKGFQSVKRNTRSNALFVSAAAQNNQPLLKNLHGWFASWNTVTDDRRFEEAFTGYLMQEGEIRSFLTKAIAIINPDVIGLEPWAGSIPAESDVQKRSLAKDHQSWSRIMFVHQSRDQKQSAKLLLTEESKGTQSYAELAGSILLTLMSGGVLLLDEADQSLHPTLLRSIVLLFQRPETNPHKAQLIFNTHDTSLLVPEVLRPDQVWFADRDAQLSSIFFCLADFEGIRSETKAQRAYLEGRFGAVPFLEEHSKIFAEELTPKKRPKNAKA